MFWLIIKILLFLCGPLGWFVILVGQALYAVRSVPTDRNLTYIKKLFGVQVVPRQ